MNSAMWELLVERIVLAAVHWLHEVIEVVDVQASGASKEEMEVQMKDHVDRLREEIKTLVRERNKVKSK